MKKFLLACSFCSGLALAGVTVGPDGRVICTGGCLISGSSGNWRVCDSQRTCVYMKVKPIPAY